MKNIQLYVPELKDYWYEQKLLADPQTMSYNAGYDVSYFGYHYDSGCIDFPEERWEIIYNKRIDENKYFAYIKDIDINDFVGCVNYQYNKFENRYECGIVIEYKYRNQGYAKKALELLCEEAKINGVKEMYDFFELERDNTLKLFVSSGFKIVKEEYCQKFNKKINGVLVKKILAN